MAWLIHRWLLLVWISLSLFKGKMLYVYGQFTQYDFRVRLLSWRAKIAVAVTTLTHQFMVPWNVKWHILTVFVPSHTPGYEQVHD